MKKIDLSSFKKSELLARLLIISMDRKEKTIQQCYELVEQHFTYPSGTRINISRHLYNFLMGGNDNSFSKLISE